MGHKMETEENKPTWKRQLLLDHQINSMAVDSFDPTFFCFQFLRVALIIPPTYTFFTIIT